VSTNVFPTIDEKLTELAKAMNLFGPMMKKLKTMVYDLAEDTVRAEIHEQIAQGYDKLQQKFKIKGAGVLETERKKKDKEDEFGFLLKAGGWKKERKRRRGAGDGPGGPMEAVGAVLDDVKETLLSLTGEAGVALEAYVEGAAMAQQEWVNGEGKEMIADAKKTKTLPKVKVPVCEWHKVGLTAALQILKPVLENMGGQMAKEAQKVNLEKPDLTAVELRRNMDQLVQHFVMDKVQMAVFPKLSKMVIAICETMELKGPVAKTVKNKAFLMAEDIVRKQIHVQVLAVFAKLEENMKVPGCGTKKEKLSGSPKDYEEDAWGWLKKGGGYPKWKKGLKSGGGIMDLVNEVLTPEIQAKLEGATGGMLPVLQAYADATQAKAEEYAGGAEPVDAENPELSPCGEVPAADFQKEGLVAGLDKLRPILEEISDEVKERVHNVMDSGMDMAARSTDIRRGLDQLLQELVVVKAREEVFPLIDSAISANKNMRGPIASKVKEVVFDLAEGMVRKEVHKKIIAAYDDMLTKVVPDGGTAIEEEGEEQLEDEWGFLISEGGYQEFKGGGGMGGLGGDLQEKAMEEVKKVLDQEMVDQLMLFVHQAQAMMDRYQAKAAEAQETWLTDAGGQAQLDDAGGDADALALIQVPTSAFQRAGLDIAIAELQPILEQLGEKILTRAEEIQAKLADARTTDMRRGLDQMLQEFVVSKATEEVFPLIEPKVVALGLPKVGGLDKLVLKMCFEMAEAMVRKGTHAKVHEVYEILMAQLAPPEGVGIALEEGEEQEEDEFGFLVSEGGYKTFKGAAGFGGMDPQTIVKKVLDPAMVDKMNSQLELMEVLLLGYKAKAGAKLQEWLVDGGGQELLDEAGEDPAALALVEVPTTEFLTAGLEVALTELLPRLEEMGGDMAERASEIYMTVTNTRSTDKRRGLSQMMQEIVVKAAREQVFPPLEAKISRMKEIPSIGGVKEKIIDLVFDLAEGMVRKEVHAAILDGYSALMQEVTPEDAGTAEEAGKEQEEDDYGFLVSEGGYQAFKGGSSLGGLDPMELVSQVMDPETVEKLNAQIEQVASLVVGYQAKADAIKDEWLLDEGQALLDAAVLLDEAGEPLMDAAGESLMDPEKLALVEVPTAQFQKAGLQYAMAELKPRLEELGGKLLERVKAIIPTDPQAELDKIMEPAMQEKLLMQVHHMKTVVEIYQEKAAATKKRWLLGQLKGQDVPGQELLDQAAIAFAEGDLNALAQVQVPVGRFQQSGLKAAVKQLQSQLEAMNPELAARAKEIMDQVELLSSMDPDELAKQVIDMELVGRLMLQVEQAEGLMEAYKAKVEEAKQEWLVGTPSLYASGEPRLDDDGEPVMDGSGQALIDAAHGKHKKLAQVQVPAAEFQKVGLAIMMEELQPLLEELGEEMKEVATRAAEVQENIGELRSTDLRRELDQLLQELVVSKSKVEVFPMVEDKASELVSELGLPQMVSGKIRALINDKAEGILRQGVHEMVVAAYDALMSQVTPEGTSMAAEEGEEQEEDEFGFLIGETFDVSGQSTSHLGYAAFKPPISIALHPTDMRRALDQMLQELVVSKATEDVFPVLEEKVSELGLPKLLDKKIRNVIIGTAEETLRKDVHSKLLEAYETLMSKVMPEGAAAAPDIGEEQEEDEYGFPVLEGGFAAFRPPISLSIHSSELRRALDQLLQEFVVSNVSEVFFPLLEEKVQALPVPSFGGIKQKVLGLVFNQAEGQVRMQVHNQLHEAFAALMVKMTPEGAAAAPEEGEAEEEDEYGFLVREGGYKAFKGAGPGGLDPEEIVKQVLDPEMSKKLSQQIEMMQTMIEGYKTQATKAQEKWLVEDGGQKLLDKAKGDPAKLEKLQVPTAAFQQAGLNVATAVLLPKMQELGGVVADRAAMIERFVLEARSTDMRRGMDQMLQEIVLKGATDEVFPLLREKVDDLPLPPFGGVKEKVTDLVFDMAEGMIRKQIHTKVLEAYNTLLEQAAPEGAGIALEAGEEAEEDEYGFLVSEGGYVKFKGGLKMGGLDPMQFVNIVMDEETVEKLQEQIEMMRAIVEGYQDKAAKLKEEWLSDEGQALLDEAGGDPEKLALIEMPTAKFQKEGMQFAMAEVQPRLQAMGGKIAVRAGALMPVDPEQKLETVMDPVMREKLLSQAEHMQAVLELYNKRAGAAKDAWLTKGGGQALLDETGGDPAKLAEVKVPTAEFQKAGMQAAMDEVRPRLEAMGGALAARVAAIDPHAMVKKLLDPDMMDKLQLQVEQMTVLVEEYQKRGDEAKNLWLKKGGQKQIDKASSDPAALANVKVPTAEFQKAGLEVAMETLLTQLQGLGGKVAVRAMEIHKKLADSRKTCHSTDMRRGLDQMLQEFVVSTATEQLFPMLRKNVMKLGLPKFLENKVHGMLFAKAEGTLRKQVHDGMLDAYESLATKLSPANRSGAGEAAELGRELEVDEYGFLVNEGGYEKFKGLTVSGMSMANMRRGMDQLLQEFVLSKAKEEVFPMLESKVEDMHLPNVLEKKMRSLIFDRAEGMLRKDIHEKLLEAFSALMERVTPPGAGVAVEVGIEELEEDAYGFALVEGGYEKFKPPVTFALHSTDMRRGLSQMLQEFVIPKVAKVVHPMIESKVSRLGLPPIGGVQEKVLALVFDQAEGVVRKQLHAIVLASYTVVMEKMGPPPGAAIAPEEAEEKEEDEYGFLVSNGGYATFKGKGPGLDPQAMVKQVLDPVLVEKLMEPLEKMQASIEAYQEKLAAIQEKWLTEEGGQALLDKAKGDPKKLAKVQVPVNRFQKAGLKIAVKELLPLIEGMGGKIAQRASKIKSQLKNARSTDLRRHLDQLLQELVVSAATADVFPMLEAKVEVLPLPPFGGIKQKVLALAFDMAEGQVRKAVHGKTIEAYTELMAKVLPEGAAVKAEKGEEQEEDEYGFLVSEGGYAKFKGSGGLDPEVMVQQVLNARMTGKLQACLEEMQALVDTYHAKGVAAANRWLKGKAGGQQLLDEAKGKPDELGLIQVPTHQIQKIGMEAAIQMLMPKLQELGGKVAERAIELREKIGGKIDQVRSTDLRRHLDQMLQELVVANAVEQVFPMLESKVEELPLPPFGGIEEVVLNMVYENAEGLVRKMTHGKFLEAYGQLVSEFVPEHVGMAVEEGEELEEDDYGFLMSEGGYAKFKGPGGLDPEAMVKKVMDPGFFEKLTAEVERVQSILEAYKTKAVKAQKAWMKNGGKAELDAAKHDTEMLAQVKAPTAEFQKEGLVLAVNTLRPELEKMKGEVAERVAGIQMKPDMRSTDMRQKLDMLVQEFVVANAKKEVFPILKTKVSDLGLPPIGDIQEKVLDLALDMAEGQVRKEVHGKVIEAYTALVASLSPVVDGVFLRSALEDGEEDEEDEYGFLVSMGGYAKFKGSSGLGGLLGALDPKQQVKKILDPEMVDKLNLQVEQAKSLVEAYKVKAAAAQKEWLTMGGGQKQLNAAAGKKKDLAKVQVPTAEFQKAGLEFAMEELLERMNAASPRAPKSPRAGAAAEAGGIMERVAEIQAMDPKELAKRVLDGPTVDILLKRVGKTKEMVESYQIKAAQVKEEWLQKGGQAQLDAAGGDPSNLAAVQVPIAEFQKEGLTVAIDEILNLTGFSPRAGGGQVAERVQAIMDTIKVPGFELFLDMDFDAIADTIDDFKQEFATDLAQAIGLEDVSRIGIRGIRGIRAGSVKVELGFTSGLSPSPNELMANVLDMFNKPSSELPGVLQNLTPEKPELLEPPRSTKMRRALDHLMQELVLAKVQEDVFPVLKEKVKELELPKIGGLSKKVKAVVLDMAESMARRGVHQNMLDAFDAMEKKLMPPGATAAFEKGVTLEEDSHGFVRADGGYAAFKPPLSAGLRSTDIRRMLDQLLQEMVVSNAKDIVFPTLEGKVNALGLPPIGGIQDTVLALVFDQAEGRLRKEIHDKLIGAYDALMAKFSPPGAGVAEEEGEEQPEDEYGFLESEGGYAKYRAEHGGGLMLAMDPKEQVKKVLDPAMVNKLNKHVEDAQKLVQAYRTEAEKEKEKWMKKGGKARYAAAKGDPKALSHLLVPTAEFQKAGLELAMSKLRPQLKKLGSEAAHRSEEIDVTADMRSTDMRRGLGQLLQAFVLAKAKAAAFPMLEAKVEDLGLPPVGGIQDKVLALVFDMAERQVRKDMHTKLLGVYKHLRTNLGLAGAGEVFEDGDEQEEDEYGFLLSEGGYEKFKGPGGLGGLLGGLDPDSQVKKVLDPSMVDHLKQQVDEAQKLLEAFKVKAAAAQKDWLTQAGGQAELDAAQSDPMELAKVSVPVAEFQKAGMDIVMRDLYPRLEELGDEPAARAEDIEVSLDQRSTDMRRGMGQLLQELVVARAKEAVYPLLQAKVAELPLPPIDGIKETVLNLTFDMAEGMVRKDVHGKVIAAYYSLSEKLSPDGTGLIEEEGEEQAEDEYGFLESEGGYKKFKGSSGFSALLGALDPAQYVKKVMDAATMAKMKQQIEEAQKLVDAYNAQCHEKKRQWLAGGGQKQLDAANGDPKRLAKVTVPTSEIQQVGLEVAMAQLRPQLDVLGAGMAKRVADILAMDPQEKLNSVLDPSVIEKLNGLSGKFPTFELSLDMDFDTIADTIDDFKQEFATDLAQAIGLEDVSRIGIRGIRAGSVKVELGFTPGLSPSPNELMTNVLDMFNKPSSELPGVLQYLTPEKPELCGLNASAGSVAAANADVQRYSAQSLLQDYQTKAVEAQDDWLGDGGGQALLDEAGGDTAKLAQVQVPTAEFQRAGMQVAVEQLQIQLERFGPHMAKRVAAIDVDVDQRTTDLRRALDQLLQELVVENVKQQVFLIMKQKIAELQIPTVGGLRRKVMALANDKAEAKVRMDVHEMVLSTYAALEVKLAPPGASVAPELGEELEEDEYGFVVTEGGYDSFKLSDAKSRNVQPAKAVGGLRSTDMRRHLDQLLQELVVAAAKKEVLPMMEAKVSGMGLPPAGGIQEIVVAMAFGKAEDQLRKEVHGKVADAYKALLSKLADQGTDVKAETGEEQKEDDYGFLVSEGGFKAFKSNRGDEPAKFSPIDMLAAKVFDEGLLNKLNAQIEQAQVPVDAYKTTVAAAQAQWLDEGGQAQLDGGIIVSMETLQNEARENAAVNALDQTEAWGHGPTVLEKIDEEDLVGKTVDIKGTGRGKVVKYKKHHFFIDLGSDEPLKIKLPNKKVEFTVLSDEFVETYIEQSVNKAVADQAQLNGTNAAIARQQVQVPMEDFQKAGLELAVAELQPKLETAAGIPKPPPFELSLDMDFDAIADTIDDFKQEFATDLAQAIGLEDVSKIGIRGIRAGSIKVELGFTSGLSPSPNELMANVLDMFNKPSSELPGVLQNLIPEKPELSRWESVPDPGPLGKRVQSLLVDQTPRISDMRRKLDLLLQELVLAKAQEEVFTQLEAKVDATPLPPVGDFDKKVILDIVFDMAEAIIRKAVHKKVVDGYTELQSKAPAGAGVLLEVGDEQEEDEYGFLVSEGGFKKFQGSNGFSTLVGSVNPLEQVKKVIDPAMVDGLRQGARERTQGLLDAYMKKSAAAQLQWKEWGGQTKLNECKSKPKKLKLVEVPVANFQKSGLEVAIQQLEALLLYEDDGTQVMGPVAERVRKMRSKVPDDMSSGRSTALRRCLDQMAQEFAVFMARKELFPVLAAKIAAQKLPKVGGIEDKVMAMVYALAEAIVRKEVHKKVHLAYDDIEVRLRPKHCGILFEGGAVVNEDEYGFALSEGGYKKFSGMTVDLLPFQAILADAPVDNVTAKAGKGKLTKAEKKALKAQQGQAADAGSLDLSGRVRGGEDDTAMVDKHLAETEPEAEAGAEEEDEEEEEGEESDDEEIEGADKCQHVLDFDPKFLHDNPNPLVKKYIKIAHMVDEKASMEIKKNHSLKPIVELFDTGIQDFILCKVALATDLTIHDLLKELKYKPDGAELEQPIPDLMKMLVTKGVESVIEGMVRQQVHGLVLTAFKKVVDVFQASMPGLDNQGINLGDLKDLRNLDIDGLDDLDDLAGGGGGGGGDRARGATLGGGWALVGGIAMGVASSSPEAMTLMNPQTMDRVMYQVTHIAELLQVYAAAAAEAQGKWFHIEGHKMLEKVSKMTQKKRKKDGKKLGLLSGKVPIPMHKFHKAGLMAADKCLRLGINKLDDKSPGNLEAKSQASQTWLDRTAPASEMRKEFVALVHVYVVAHTGLAVYPDMHRRIGELDVDLDPEAPRTKKELKQRAKELDSGFFKLGLKGRALERMIQESMEETLREAVETNVKGAYDQIGFKLHIPGTEMIVEEGDTDERFGGCKVCGKELCKYDGTHPDFDTFGELDEWDCDVCGKDFGSSDVLFCCKTFGGCDWGACKTCQILINPTEDGPPTGNVDVEEFKAGLGHTIGTEAITDLEFGLPPLPNADGTQDFVNPLIDELPVDVVLPEDNNSKKKKKERKYKGKKTKKKKEHLEAEGSDWYANPMDAGSTDADDLAQGNPLQGQEAPEAWDEDSAVDAENPASPRFQNPMHASDLEEPYAVVGKEKKQKRKKKKDKKLAEEDSLGDTKFVNPLQSTE
jgi:hypothetical protein